MFAIVYTIIRRSLYAKNSDPVFLFLSLSVLSGGCAEYLGRAVEEL
jgi:hypothetical protein